MVRDVVLSFLLLGVLGILLMSGLFLIIHGVTTLLKETMRTKEEPAEPAETSTPVKPAERAA